MPDYIFDIIEGKNMCNFYNIVRIKGDLPFLKNDDITIELDLNEKNELSGL